MPFVSPVYDAPSWAVARTAAGVAGLAQPWMVPDWVAKMNLDGVELPSATGNAVVALNTMPVGPPTTGPTLSGTCAPAAVYSVEVSVPLSETHHGVAGPATMPQPLTSRGSVAVDWRTWTWNALTAFGLRATAGVAAMATSARLARSARVRRAMGTFLQRRRTSGDRDGCRACWIEYARTASSGFRPGHGARRILADPPRKERQSARLRSGYLGRGCRWPSTSSSSPVNFALFVAPSGAPSFALFVLWPSTSSSSPVNFALFVAPSGAPSF